MAALQPVDIVNRAILQIGDNNTPVTGNLPNFDGSTQGIAAGALYPGVVQTVAREFGFDFARNHAALVASGGAPPTEWQFEYAYPTNGIEVRQIIPAAIADPNDPRPVRWTVGNSSIGGVPTKVIWTNLAAATAVFTNQPPEALWDAGFVEAVVRLLASELAMAVPGRPETSKMQLEAAGEFERAAEMRDG